MTIGAKILVALAGLCFFLWAIVISLGIQPLFRDRNVEVIYGLHEDFRADGAAYRRFRNHDLILAHLPGASPERQWWAIDFRDRSIRSVTPPRSAGASFFTMKGDLRGTAIGSGGAAEEWLWRFSGDSVSYTNRAFSCSVRRAHR